MPGSAHTQEYLTSLEDLLVEEFRTLQTLVAITKDERLHFGKNDPNGLMRLVERKESLLDQFNLMEDSRRMLVQEIAVAIQISTQTTSLAELLPHLEPALAGRLSHLSEGIVMLANQARDLNYGNKVMASTTLEWLSATKAFLFKLCQPDMGYFPPGVVPSLEMARTWDIDHRA